MTDSRGWHYCCCNVVLHLFKEFLIVFARSSAKWGCLEFEPRLLSFVDVLLMSKLSPVGTTELVRGTRDFEMIWSLSFLVPSTSRNKLHLAILHIMQLTYLKNFCPSNRNGSDKTLVIQGRSLPRVPQTKGRWFSAQGFANKFAQSQGSIENTSMGLPTNNQPIKSLEIGK